MLWLVGEDGQRHRLTQDFPITFYAAGEPARLRLPVALPAGPAGKGGAEALRAARYLLTPAGAGAGSQGEPDSCPTLPVPARGA